MSEDHEYVPYKYGRECDASNYCNPRSCFSSLQYNGHHSYDNNELLYWKETKPFNNGCSAHVTGGSYAMGNLALPDHATFLIENTLFGESVSLEAAHHCNVGTTGVLCFPTCEFLFFSLSTCFVRAIAM